MLSKLEKRVREVERAHGYIVEDGRCTCGEELRDHPEADLHFSVAMYAAGHADGVAGRKF